MPSLDIVPSTNDITVSPISTPWVFEENDTETVLNESELILDSQIPAIETTDYTNLQPQSFRYTYYPVIFSTEESTTQPLERPLRHILRLSRSRRQISSDLIIPPSTNLATEWLTPAHCLTENITDESFLTPSSYNNINNNNIYNSNCIKNKYHPCIYPLHFKIISHDGGCYSSIYDISNILNNDSSVYCSGRTGTVNILLRYNGNRGFMDKNCTLSKMIIRSPGQGFTAPCKDGLVFISHYPIDVEKTHQYDHFTKEDYQQYCKSKNMLDREDYDPVAWFSVNDNQQEINIDNRSGKYVLIKLLRSEFDDDNIDLQYIGFLGYSGPQYFPSSPKFC